MTENPGRERGHAALLERGRRPALGRRPGVQGTAQPGKPRAVAGLFAACRRRERARNRLRHRRVTLPLAQAVGVHGRVVAVDISEPMLGVARQRIAESGMHNVTLLQGDAQVFALEPQCSMSPPRAWASCSSLIPSRRSATSAAR